MRIAWGFQQSLSDARIHQKLGIFCTKARQFARYQLSLFRGQFLRAFLAELGGVEANPNTIHFRAGVPEGDVFFEVTGPLEHRAGDGPMNVYLTILKVRQNAFVSCRLAADIVMFGQTVDRHRNPAAAQSHPFARYWNYSACHDQSKHTLSTQLRKYAAQFAMPDQRLATH